MNRIFGTCFGHMFRIESNGLGYVSPAAKFAMNNAANRYYDRTSLTMVFTLPPVWCELDLPVLAAKRLSWRFSGHVSVKHVAVLRRLDNALKHTRTKVKRPCPPTKAEHEKLALNLFKIHCCVHIMRAVSPLVVVVVVLVTLGSNQKGEPAGYLAEQLVGNN